MSAFNDFCIVCDQLIPQESLPKRVDKLLYCSEQCMVADTGRVPPTEASESVATLSDVDELIASPLLLPLDCKSWADNEEDSEYLLMELESASQAVPRTQTGLDQQQYEGPKQRERVELLDRVAEDNYKLWLSQHY
ncbi:ECL1 (YGR146C) [Zygosaccharomyces parabailii]|nr:ECL1 (YGR146C) [Zygosaccharomyces parabailii]CDH13569.1 uncharacterized protein ZBAI_05355 [Zygosaccharomyces bailii ISA1307]